MLYVLYQIGQYLSLRLSLSACYKVANFFADIYYIFARSDKKNLAENLKVVLGKDDKRLIRRYTRSIFRNFAKYLADFFRFPMLTREYIMSHITLEGKEKLDKALSEGKGVIAMTAHLGNWELGGAVVASLGYPVFAIVLDHKDKRINDFFIRQRSITNVSVIQIGAQLKNCFKVLRQNKLLAIVGDRVFSNYGIKSNFFGHPTMLPKGPAFFSLKTGAPIVPIIVVRTDDDNFKIIFGSPIRAVKTGDMEADIKNMVDRYALVLEKYIKMFPDQWYAFQKVWR